jgi:hypothetical protein
MGELLNNFVAVIEKQNMLQGKFLKTTLADITNGEIISFENILLFYMKREDNTIEQIAEKYLKKIAFTMEDQIYFFQNGKYRFSKFSEVENYYKDSDYMKYYTTGLGLSTYLWATHRNIMRFFINFIAPPPLCFR